MRFRGVAGVVGSGGASGLRLRLRLGLFRLMGGLPAGSVGGLLMELPEGLVGGLPVELPGRSAIGLLVDLLGGSAKGLLAELP
jgi:hypothetical protein